MEQAAANLEAMRKAEGEKLAEDLMAKGQNIKELLDKIAERAPMAVSYTHLHSRTANTV